MKSIKQQYIDLKEGRMSQQNFMRNLRMTMPQYVTNVTSYGDAVKILRNKGILTESFIKQLESETGDAPISKMSKKDMIDFLGTEEAKDMSDEELRDAVADNAGKNKINEEDGGTVETQIEEWEVNISGKTYLIDANVDVDFHYESDDYEDHMITSEGGFEIDNAVATITKLGAIEGEDIIEIEDPTTINQIQNLINTNPELNRALEKTAGDSIDWWSLMENAGDKNKDEDEEKFKKAIAAVDAALEKGEETDKPEYLKMQDFPGTISEAKSKWENTSGKSMYAQFKEIDNLNGQEVLIGIDYEIEKNHELSKLDAIKLVLKNLKKNPVYYTATLMAGKEMTEIPTIGKLKPGSDKMRPVKGEDSLVDKDNGMKPVKDVEKVKASANKAKKETNKAAGTISLMSLVAKASRGVNKMNATGEKMKVVKEARLNLFPNEQPNEATKQAEDYINSNPTLKAISKDIVLQNAADDRSILGYKSWDFLPEPALEKLKLQFNVERDAEEHDDRLPTYYYILTPKFKKSTQSPIAQALTKEDLMEMIREELEEALGAYGGDNITDVAGHQLDEDIYGIAGNLGKERAAKKSQIKKKQYEPLDKTAAKNIELDNILDDAERNIEIAARTVGNDTKLGIALINRAREKKPKLVSALKTALNLYK